MRLTEKMIESIERRQWKLYSTVQVRASVKSIKSRMARIEVENRKMHKEYDMENIS